MIARVHSLIPNSSVNGPGQRAVVWFQGCQGMNCPGCWNPETHSSLLGISRTPIQLLNWVGAIRHPLDGVTFSGGEPMQQPGVLLELTRLLAHHAPHLSLGMFSGYTERELEAIPEWTKIRGYLDWAVLGRYNRMQASQATPLVTSSNQRLVLYSRCYSVEDFAPLAVEIQVGTDGLTQITGFPVLGNLV